MKKKNLNAKLHLSKKTIAKLNDNVLQDIQGGASLPLCIDIRTRPVVCNPIPVTTTRTTSINSLACPTNNCPTDDFTSVINPGGQYGV